MIEEKWSEYLSKALSLSFFWGGVLFRAIAAAYGVPRLGVKSELQLLASTTATAIATQDQSRVFDLRTAHSNTGPLTH